MTSNHDERRDDLETPNMRGRVLAFVAILAICLIGGIGYAGYAQWRARASAQGSPIAAVKIDSLPSPSAASTPASGFPEPVPSSAPSPAATAATSEASSSPASQASTSVAPAVVAAKAPRARASNRAYLLFRSTALGETYGRVSLQYLDGKDSERFVSPLQCDRVHFAAGHGICLEAKRAAVTTYEAKLFDRDFKIEHSFPLAGPPSRARISPDGRFAAMTVFVNGHTYASTTFITRTSIVDTQTGQMVVDDMEGFEVLLDGRAIKATDFNFWGVTFTHDPNRFYATLGTGGKLYLVEGDMAARRVKVIREDVECPSLSPDDTRIAHKRRVVTGSFGRFTWHIYVLDLATGKDTELPGEARNVDDQVEWLDAHNVIYGLNAETQTSTAATNVWRIPADGSGAPTMLMPLAFSPAVVR